jgi:hypothetical protein
MIDLHGSTSLTMSQEVLHRQRKARGHSMCLARPVIKIKGREDSGIVYVIGCAIKNEENLSRQI